jgi:SAM-dependent methyltransferase
MSTCCGPNERMFGKKQARRDARRFRRKGLDGTARRMVDDLAARGVDGASVLEVGGGVGGIEIELLRAGAARATNVELSPGYEDEARALLAESDLEGRVDRRVGDFVETSGAVEPADVVVLHRVVCCYPDEEALVGAASERAGRLLALSFPRYTLLSRAGVPLANAIARKLLGFELYLRPARAVLAPAEARGLRVAGEHKGFFWRYAVLERG